jgi:hypothetical protein
LRKCKAQRNDEILAELIEAGGDTLQSENRKLINSILNKEELLNQWKDSVMLAICKMGDKTDYNNYHGILLLSMSYNILSNIQPAMLSSYVDEIFGDCQF